MDARYEAFCFADPLFYEDPARANPDEPLFADSLPAVPIGWWQGSRDVWTVLHPHAVNLPAQGWKVHVSAALDNAERVLRVVWGYCVANRLAFKFLRGPRVLLARNSKYAARASGGKLVTIYPVDEAELARVLRELSAPLAGEHGPYILSDLRYGSGPLYVRWGGFAQRWTTDGDGHAVHAVARPDGKLVPDERKPYFVLPDWVTVPEFLEPHLAARKNGGDPNAFPYGVEAALHFSNGGGVYLATSSDGGDQVVLKEARPHAGLDRDGTDAVTRLNREHTVLERLAGIRGIPAVHDSFVAWEHHFLALERIPGTSLGRWLAREYPLSRPDGDPGKPTALRAYAERVQRIVARIERLIDAVHDRGLVFGDLHPHNILIDDNDQVGLVDFELASDIEQPRRPALGAAGFFAPADRVGPDTDRYALAALRLWFFLPLNVVTALDPDKVLSYVDLVRELFPVEPNYFGPVLTELAPRTRPDTARSTRRRRTEFDADPPNWSQVRRAIVDAIVASATPERRDRLFPGDIAQFTHGGAPFAYGAAGVLHALHVAGAGRFDKYERWLLDNIAAERPRRPGFYDGAHGVAYVLDELGYRTEAGDLVAAATPAVAELTDHGLGGGLAGVALNLLHLGRRWDSDDLVRHALAIGERLAGWAGHPGPPPARAKAGLLHGWSGPALLFLRLYEHTADPAWLAAADQALHRDLDECTERPDGTWQVRDGALRTLPYLEVGSAGIALVLGELATLAPAAGAVSMLDALLRSCRAGFVSQPGLFLGRAGLVAALTATARRRRDPRDEQLVWQHLRQLGWFAIPYRDGIAFPGNQLRRLSMDVGTGNAGVLLALAHALDGTPPLPFLRGTHGQRPATDGAAVPGRATGPTASSPANPGRHPDRPAPELVGTEESH
ncbi:serine/threonine protein kinase [Longimycelium tulufanense]|uniref:Serine/threonine protein kinase n=1 Tax=Longimycelium tulufanense TaxID=907463 RepID=A0A8J3C9Y9_9PSEU|nr:class III lanthionine synthetase LanKC [Longimycelium tulufanense]GGM63176.1 serine/threonine protein kinase [Longimycelium tulufanense]